MQQQDKTELKDCDLIMKGGVTSGVVYPHAIRAIAKEYRLRSIGGTSAGAIAAAFAAAAEYRRQTNNGSMAGFDEIGEVAGDLGKNMGAFFQPTTAAKPLFATFMAVIEKERRWPARVWTALRDGFENQLLFGLLCALMAVFVGVITQSWVVGAALLVLAPVLTAISCVCVLRRAIFGELPRQDFGMCTGKTMSGAKLPAFGDWIAEQIDVIAGKADGPLTVGDLRPVGIDIATVTTDLTFKRPYRLPMQTAIHLFSKAEFTRLFPAKIVDYLCDKGGPWGPHDSGAPHIPTDLYRLPTGDEFPVYLVARMSLSFPGLISTVPLWRPDYLVKGAFRRCVFSDGGISSNFPIHFFDSFLPSRPTFGIALASYVEEAHDNKRIDLPTSAPQNTNVPYSPVATIGGFLGAILNTAKDWQDAMQSLLPGHAERIVTVRLDDKREGGLNLNMPSTVIKKLGDYGQEAGDLLVSEFDMDAQQITRARALFPALEDALSNMSATYDADYLKLLQNQGGPNSKAWKKDPFAAFGTDLKAIGDNARALTKDPKRKSIGQGDNPSLDAEVRLVASEDRRPKGR